MDMGICWSSFSGKTLRTNFSRRGGLETGSQIQSNNAMDQKDQVKSCN